MSASVVEAALRRVSEWEDLALAETTDAERAAAFAVPPAYLLEAVRSADRAQRAQLRRLLRNRVDSPSAVLSRRFVRWMLRKNQFLLLDPPMRRRIHDTYDRGFLRVLQLADQATSRELSLVLDEHGNALRSLVLEITGGHLRDVISAEYRPATQLAVLGLAVESLRGPVLDIGSGEHAFLVHHLRSAGFDAHGIDRLARGEMQADWLSFDPGSSRWGTITAHHSFTLHFHHHHRRAGAARTAATYAEAFMRYLFALDVGGTFAYAPSAPFFERILPPDRWGVRRNSRIISGVPTTSSHITRRY